MLCFPGGRWKREGGGKLRRSPAMPGAPVAPTRCPRQAALGGATGEGEEERGLGGGRGEGRALGVHTPFWLTPLCATPQGCFYLFYFIFGSIEGLL